MMATLRVAQNADSSYAPPARGHPGVARPAGTTGESCQPWDAGGTVRTRSTAGGRLRLSRSGPAPRSRVRTIAPSLALHEDIPLLGWEPTHGVPEDRTVDRRDGGATWPTPSARPPATAEERACVQRRCSRPTDPECWHPPPADWRQGPHRDSDELTGLQLASIPPRRHPSSTTPMRRSALSPPHLSAVVWARRPVGGSGGGYGPGRPTPPSA